MKVKITSLFLVLALLFSTTGCSLSKKNNTGKIDSSVVLSQDEIQNSIRDRMIEFIDIVEKSNSGIDLSNFYNKVKTLQIVYEKTNNKYYNSYYDKDRNVIVLNLDTPEALEHELLHVIFNNGLELNSLFIEEGITELLSSELCDTEYAYRYNVGVIKILSIILGRDKVMDCINKKDLNIIIAGLADIKPSDSDAEELLKYMEYEHLLMQKLHQEIFTKGNIDDFRLTKDYETLKNIRMDITNRLKIYIKSYFMDKVREQDIKCEDVLVDMLTLLDVVNIDLFDPDVEDAMSNDFFLKDEVSYLKDVYDIDAAFYDRCYSFSKERGFLIDNNIVVIDKIK